MQDLRDLYEQMLLDHNRNPRNFGKLEPHTHDAYGYNPICQDEFTVYLDVQDGMIKDIKFDGAGCAVSTASASLMTQALKGKALAEGLDLFNRMRKVMTGTDDGIPEVKLGKLKILEGVQAYPTRIKCAALAWHIFHAAVEGNNEPINTEGEHFCPAGNAAH